MVHFCSIVSLFIIVECARPISTTSTRFFSNALPTLSSHTFVFCVMCSVELYHGYTGGSSSSFLGAFISNNVSLLKAPNIVGPFSEASYFARVLTVHTLV